MPIRPPRLDDRAYPDLVAELLARIPSHTPEWTDPRPGDPGRTLIELFAWLADAMLYRVNFIPERQRLEFLRMVGLPLRPARPARGLVTLSFKDLERPGTELKGVVIAPWARVKGPPEFETVRAVNVLPVLVEAYYKRVLRADEEKSVQKVLPQLGVLYELGKAKPRAYVTTPTFPGGAAIAAGVDLATGSVDKTLWLAVLAGRKEDVAGARASLQPNAEGLRQAISIGVVPALEPETDDLEGGVAPRPIPAVWEIATGRVGPRGPEYIELEKIYDSTAGLTRTGVVELVLPGGNIGAPPNDVRKNIDAGVGTRPPRLDLAQTEDRLVTWIRLRPTVTVDHLRLSWVGAHAVEIDQRRTLTSVLLGVADGTPEQSFALPLGSVERAGFSLQVEEEGRGWVEWAPLEHLGIARAEDRAYVLDDEEGRVVFGDGVRGRIPELGRRVLIAAMRAGGGEEGNLPPGALKSISAKRIADAETVSRPLLVSQPAATVGGARAETLEEAERRIPQVLRHRDRAVTADDILAVTASTPGIPLGRIEVLPGFSPQGRHQDVPGVVSVMVLPQVAGLLPPNPRPGRHTIEAVHDWLSPRVTLGTQLHVIGCEYVPLGASVGYELREGFGRDETSLAVKLAIRRFLWPLLGGGPFGDERGWPIARAVRTKEIEVVIARVPGVDEVRAVKLFLRGADDEWKRVGAGRDGSGEVRMKRWQLPELLALVVTDGDAPDSLDSVPGSGTEVAVPVVPRVC